jgi:hypothetical protein
LNQFEDYFFKYNFQTSKEEWIKLIEESDEPIIFFRIVQARACSLVETFSDLLVTPERLAWWSIWNRTFTILDNLVKIYENAWTTYQLDILSRISFEAEIQMFCIFEPLFAYFKIISNENQYQLKIDTHSESKVWPDVLNRLRAYAAYCLFMDILLYKKIIKNLDSIWDPEPVNKIINDPITHKAFLQYSGSLEIFSDTEIKLGKENHRKSLNKSIHRLNIWLDHPSLTNWHNELRKYLSNKKEISFYNLLDSSESRIIDRLKVLGVQYAKIAYDESSMILHHECPVKL